MIKKVVWMGLCLGILAWTAVAEEETAKAVMQASQDLMFQYQSLTAQADIKLYSGGRNIGMRQFRLALRENDALEDDKSLLEVAEPRSLKGIRLLSWSSENGDDKQWMFTPRLKRLQRIGGSARNAQFVGSDFVFEDLLKWQLSNYKYEQLEKNVDGDDHGYVLTAIPKRASSMYSRIQIELDRMYRIKTMTYYDKYKKKLKQLRHMDYSLFSNQYWQPMLSEMEDFQKRTTTVIQWSDYEFNTIVTDDLFRPTTTKGKKLWLN